MSAITCRDDCYGVATYYDFGMNHLLTAIREMGITTPCFAAGDIEAIPDAKGAYVLLIRLERSADIKLRKRDSIRLQPGRFVYAGSAKGSGGLRARLRRHFRKEKTPHWHIDQLTIRAEEIASLPVSGGDECELVGRLLRCPAFAVAISNFGNTDCKTCETHLLRLCR